MSRPVRIVEIDLDFCDLRHPAGLLPGAVTCSASSPEPCYNTWATCQDPDSFTREVKTFRFVEPLSDLPLWLNAFPYLRAASLRGTVIDPGRSLGQRAQLTVKLKGGRHHDRGIDPYVAGRGYDPMTRGSMLGKLWARNRFYEGRAVRLLRGDLDRIEADGDLSSCEVRRYVAEKVAKDGGEWVLTAKDPLKLADGDRSLWPRHSRGDLAAALTAVGTAAVLSPAGVGSDYPAAGYVRINDEIMAFTRDGDALALTRSASVAGIWETGPAAHDAGDAVQLCRAYVDVPVWEIARELLVEAAGLDPAFIDDAEWLAEFEAYIPTQRLTAMLSEPEQANKLLNELQPQTGHYLFWDERASRVRFRALRFPTTAEAIPRLDDSATVVEGSIDVKDRPEDRISRLIVGFAQRDPTRALDDAGNYRRYQIDSDQDAAGPNEYGAHRVETIYSRWHSAGGRTNVLAFARRLVVTFAKVRRAVEVEVAFKDAALAVGDLVDLATRQIEDASGAALTLRGRVYSEAPGAQSIRVEIRESAFTSRRLFLWSPNALHALSWSGATAEQRETNGFWGDAEGRMPDGSIGYRWG